MESDASQPENRNFEKKNAIEYDRPFKLDFKYFPTVIYLISLMITYFSVRCQNSQLDFHILHVIMKIKYFQLYQLGVWKRIFNLQKSFITNKVNT